NPAARSAALEALARVVESRGDMTTFERVLSEIGDETVVERCRAGSAASVYFHNGRDAVAELIASLQDPSAKARASVELAIALARDHKLPEAEQAIANVQLGATDAAIALVTAVADSGDFSNAERLAKEIGKPEGRAYA